MSLANMNIKMLCGALRDKQHLHQDVGLHDGELDLGTHFSFGSALRVGRDLAVRR